jgi:hypothetical protein
MATLPNYLEAKVQELTTEIIAGFDAVKELVPDIAASQYLTQLKQDFLQVAGRFNAIPWQERNEDDPRVIQYLATNRAIVYFERLSKES